MSEADRAVDRLYQVPLGEFTAARNALARELKQPALKQLEKPSLAAWAVNQLYWHDRKTYDRLLAASRRLHDEHRKLLGGRAADVRTAEAAHREAVREALDAVKRQAQQAGESLSAAVVSAVQETLAALPSDETPGRLVKPLKPRGFDALAGVAVKPQLRVVPPPARADTAHRSAGRVKPEDGRDTAKARAAREREEKAREARRQEAEKALQAAEAAMLSAEEAVKNAERKLAQLRAARDEAVSEYHRARLRARE